MESLNLSKEGVSVISSDNSITHELSEEFVLPDYIPEIRKLLSCKAQVLPEGRYVGEKNVQGSGSVTYHLVYTDDEGNLCGTPLSSSYEVEVPIAGDSQGIFLDTMVESVMPRVNGPRRISIKSRLKSRALCLEKREVSENISPKSNADEMFLQRQQAELNAFDIYQARLEGIKISDQFDIRNAKTVKPLWCDEYAIIKEQRVRNGSVSIRGDVTVKCICQGQDEIITLTKSVPLAEELECEGAREGLASRACARCVSLSISNEQNLDTPQLFFDICCEIEAEVLKKRKVEVTTDCYSTKYESEAGYKELESYDAVKMATSTTSYTDGIKRKNNEATQIIDQMVTPIIEKADVKGTKLVIQGKLSTAVIGARRENDDDIEVEYICDTYELPFKHEIELGKEARDVVSRINVVCGMPSARYDEDKLYLSCDMYFMVTALEKNRARVLDYAIMDKEKEVSTDGSVIRVYFPKEKDTLWEIAKRFHTTVSKITEDNEKTDKTELIV